MTYTNYNEYLASKLLTHQASGFEPQTAALPLFEWQSKITQWSLRQGCSAMFEDCGLGKTPQQLEWARQVAEHTGKTVLILTPLAVAQQTMREACKFGVEANVAQSGQDIDCDVPVNITNYERLHLFDDQIPTLGGVVLDESSILKAYMGKTKRRLIEAFAKTPYKLCCTATPAPNDYLELGNHAEFLGIMSSAEMISRWFINDLAEAGKYRLKKHAEADYWRWVASWAVCVSCPADLGYPNEGFELPPLEWIEDVIAADCPPPDGMLLHTERLSSTNMHAVMRATAQARADQIAQKLSAEADEPWLVWVNTNYEADAIKRLLPHAAEVRGSDSIAAKEDALVAFSEGHIRTLITKPGIAGYGLNWQHCARVGFLGLTYSYEDLYQAIRRCWRFGQQRPVHAHVVISEAERSVLHTIHRKAADHERMKEAMRKAMLETQLSHRDGHISLKLADAIETTTGDGWTMHLGDCVQSVAKHVPDDSVGLSIFSPPFANLYIYSDSVADMGNSAGEDEFFEHFAYLIPELWRVTIPGRICAVHCKDLPRYRGRDGAAGLVDFPGRIIREFERHGWTYHSRVTIWKSPVTEMTRTKNQGLLYKQLRKDSSYSRQGMADYVIAFRKWGGFDSTPPDPVPHSTEEFPLDAWQQLASPVWDYEDLAAVEKLADVCDLPSVQVWHDIQQTKTLNVSLARGDRDEKHICPLQLDLIARCLKLWSKPGDVVLSPFAGVGSEGYVSILGNRRFIGCELKDEYFNAACRHLSQANNVVSLQQNTLFAECKA